MISLSTKNIVLIAALAVVVILLGWYFFFSDKSNREGFQATTAELPPGINVDQIVKNMLENKVDKDRVCPMIEVQFNTLNQQLQLFKEKGNEPMVKKMTDILLSMKTVHEQMKCDEPTLAPDGSRNTQ